MRTLTTLALISVTTLVSACATPDNGYYDKNGNWIPNNPYNREAHDHSPLPGGTDDSYSAYNHHRDHRVTTTTTTYSYDRPGYYDYNGYYIPMDSGLAVPTNMFPPHGMCRVWFPDNAPADQPGIESCEGIQARVPYNAYVIYGG